MIPYRREIDGLRAVAVVPVILFHAGFQTFSGGFVGVDVFFVISGYLITSLILSDMESGNFSILKFYERRARRILPALFLVMAACLPFAWMWLLPSDMKDFSKSLVAVSAFASNVLFWRQSGYFDSAAELKPLLHTWSLAVEEQYYVLYPLFLILAWRFGRRWIVGILGAVAVISLAIAEWGSINNPAATFFLLPTRGWELLIGSLVAFYFAKEKVPEFKAWQLQVGGLLGIALVLISVFAFSYKTPFPGVYALVPTVGTALVILFARQQTLVGRLLGSGAFVGVGLISYSAYLWHQPMFAFARHRSLEEPSAAVYLALAAGAIVLAYFSWRFVEQPFRDRSRVGRSAVFRSAVACSLVALSIGMVGISSDGYYYRSSLAAKLGNLDERLAANHGLSEDCEGRFNLSSKCSTSASPELLLWGDSNAMHLAQGLLASNPDLRMIQATVSVCGPFFDVAPMNQKYTAKWGRECIRSNDELLDWLRTNKTIKYAVLSSPFRQYVDEDARLLHRSGEILRGDDVSLAYFRKTLETLKSLGIRPVVFSPTPQNGEDLGRCVAKARLFSLDERLCDFPLSAAYEGQAHVVEFLRKVGSEHKVVWLFDEICRNDRCIASSEDVFIYRDRAHLSREGSAYLGKKLNFYQQIVGGRAEAAD
jgi:peptidoglycan/LPS O-acetylase OafA/YrhL